MSFWMNHQNTSSDCVNIRFHEGRLTQKIWICIPKMAQAEGYLVCCFRELKVICFIVLSNDVKKPNPSCLDLSTRYVFYVQFHIVILNAMLIWEAFNLCLLTLIYNKKLEPVRSYLETLHAFSFSEFTMWLLTILFPYILPDNKLKKEKCHST